MGASYFLVIVVLIQFVDALEITRMKSTNNSSITLLCTATSSATNTIEWRFGNNTIDGGDAKYNVSVEDESTAFSVKLMSFLTINHPDINDEGNYTCNRGSDSSTELMLTVPPQNVTSTFQSKDLVVSTSDGNITIDCGVEIGPVSANRKCAVIRLHVGNSDNEVPGVELHNMTHPSFTISELNLNHDLYRCRISWDATTGCTEFPTFDGPISYNLFFDPLVSVSSDYENAVPEGTNVSFSCNFKDQNSATHPEYTIYWSILDTEANYSNVTDQYVGNEWWNRTTIQFSPVSDVSVRCSVVATVGDVELRNMSSLELAVLQNINGVRIVQSECGTLNITIGDFPKDIIVTTISREQNYTIEKANYTIAKGSPAKILNIGNATEIVLVSLYRGLKGNEHGVHTPNDCGNETTSTTLVFNLTKCDDELTPTNTNKQAEDILDEITDSCELEICPQITERNRRIINTARCSVTVIIEGISERLLLNAAAKFCSSSHKCDVMIQTTSTPPTVTVPPPQGPMANWMIICLCSFAVLIVLIVILVFCVICSLCRRFRKKRTDYDVEKARDGNVSTVSIKGSQADLQMTAAEGRNETTHPSYDFSASRAETQSQSSNRSNFSNHSSVSQQSRFSGQSHHSGQSQHSHLSQHSGQSLHSGLSLHSRQSQYSGQSHSTRNSCSTNQSRSSSHLSRHPRAPSSLSYASCKRDPSTGVATVSLNLTINDRDSLRTIQAGEFNVALPLVSMFNELGELLSDKQTQVSSDTGFSSVVASHGRLQNTLSVSNSQRRSMKSSGYGGSDAVPSSTNNDPSIMNPHGKRGYTSSFDRNDHPLNTQIPHYEHIDVREYQSSSLV